MAAPDAQRRYRICLFPDYAGTVLWLGDPIEYEVSGLSRGLVRSLQVWEESYYRSLTPDFGWVSAEAARQFTAEGNRLAQRLADELGPGYEVSFNSYEDGVPGRVFRSSGATPNAEAVAAFSELGAARQIKAGAPGTDLAGKGVEWFVWAPLSDTSFPHHKVDGE